MRPQGVHHVGSADTSLQSSFSLLCNVSVRAFDRIVARISVPIRPFLYRIPLRLASLIVDRGQAAATFERIHPDARHRVRNRHRGQAAATAERTFPDARHTIRDRDRRQTAAIFERLIPDARHATVRWDHACSTS